MVSDLILRECLLYAFVPCFCVFCMHEGASGIERYIFRGDEAETLFKIVFHQFDQRFLRMLFSSDDALCIKLASTDIENRTQVHRGSQRSACSGNPIAPFQIFQSGYTNIYACVKSAFFKLLFNFLSRFSLTG